MDVTLSEPAVQPASVQTDGIWFGPSARPLAGWLSHRVDAQAVSAIVIAPPTGYAYWCAHRPLRMLAERLTASGHDVLRIDYDGTGDSAGDQWESDRLQAWRDSLAAAVREVRGRGAETVTLVGARLGATVALLDARELGADRVVAWLPPARGRRYTKEVRLLSESVPVSHEPRGREGTRVLAGNVFTADTVREISGLTLTDLTGPPAESVLVIDTPSGTSSDAVAQLRELGTTVEHLVSDDAQEALETPPEYAVPPGGLLDQIAKWIGPAPETVPISATAARAGDVTRSLPAVARIPWRGGTVREQFMRLGPERHAAVMTEPDDDNADPDAALLVLLNPGSETHVGPGRAWVEYARELALAGRCTVRVDFLGWGESPEAGATPGRPYDAACVGDTLSIVEALRRVGHRRIVIGGLCASAWIALAAARHEAVDGVIAINPQLYWQPGDPVEIDWDLIRAERADEIRHVERGARLHLWDVTDAVGLRGRVGHWLDDLADGPARVELLFTEADDGLVYLERRHGRRLHRLRDAGVIGVHQVADIDHPMHLTWLRPGMVHAIEQSLVRIDQTIRGRERASAAG